jgi:hypothetical protein
MLAYPELPYEPAYAANPNLALEYESFSLRIDS